MTVDREKILRYYRASGDEELAARLLDLAESTQRSRKYRVSEFLDPYGFTIAETVAAQFDSLKLECDGGFQGAERVRGAFIAEDFPGGADFGIVAVSATWDGRYYQLAHRDVLGALMGLGIKREVMGDIIMTGSGCQIVLDSMISEYVIANLSTIGAANIKVESIPITTIIPRSEKLKEIKSTVASLRLDAIAAAGFGTSRTKMTAEIVADKVKVNWQSAKSAAQTIKTGDIISMRGRGRVEVCDILGQTKKGRFSIYLKRYL